MRELILRGSQIESHIYIETGILENVAKLSGAGEETTKICIVTDTNVLPLYFDVVKQSFENRGKIVFSHVMEAGEEYKTLATVADIYHTLAENGLARKDMIVALGGGVVGDIAGFVAATYMRGMEHLVQIPTTLLAQVDSSVGGKCGVDLPQGKNLVGAFRQPNEVIIDPNVLETLPDDIYAAGMAEVIKYGCIWAPEILDQVCEKNLREKVEKIKNIIIKCVDIKRQVVEEDETEMGLRRILNFGHTVGHGAETLGNYTDLSHGEAVSIGMIAALKMGESIGITVYGAAEKLGQILEQYQLPTQLNASIDEVFQAMMSDKKKQGQRISFVYMTEFGKTKIVTTRVAELKEIMKVLSED